MSGGSSFDKVGGLPRACVVCLTLPRTSALARPLLPAVLASANLPHTAITRASRSPDPALCL